MQLSSFNIQNWGFARILRLALGLFVLYQAYSLHDYAMGAFGIFFLFQAVTNTGCCASGNCNIETSQKIKNNTIETSYDKIK